MNEEIKINKALLPLSWLYGLGVDLRNKLFDWKILPTEEFSVPVISIGNITVGGTGKTPHTEYLIRLLNSKFKVAVLSRGYKRKTKGFILADKKSSSSNIGDEPYQIFRKFPEIVVAVDSDRRRGIHKLLSLPEENRPEIILLDDAFQHRYVTPSLSILLTDSNRLFYDDKLLPAGRLREPAYNHNRADIVIVTKCPETLTGFDYSVIKKNLNLYPFQQLFFTSYAYGNLTPVFPELNNGRAITKENISNEKTSVLLVTGIASPGNLIALIQKTTPHLETLVFPDHHNFSKEDIAKIKTRFNKIPASDKIIITTEKDAVRLMDNPLLPDVLKEYIYYLPIQVTFNLDQEKIFIQKIENHVKDFTRNSIVAQATDTTGN